MSAHIARKLAATTGTFDYADIQWMKSCIKEGYGMQGKPRFVST